MSIRACVNDVSVKLGTVQALDGVSLEIEPGQFLALLGPSGSGKTTTLNVLAGFVRPDSGTVTFDDADVTRTPPHRRDIGIVFQGYALFPHMTVAENVAFPLRRRGVGRAQREARVADALRLVGLDQHAARAIATLSGGQRQRVALARAIVFEPRMMLLDEPLAALDKQLRDTMQHELRSLQQRVGITTVAVTHDQIEALTMADVVAVMRDGRIEQVGPPRELYLRPATLFVATFLGEANLVPVDGGEVAGFSGRLATGPGQAVIRPEHLALHRDATAGLDGLTASATVEAVSFQGARLRIRARLDDAPDHVVTLSDVPTAGADDVRIGQRVVVAVHADDVHVVATTEPPVPAPTSTAPAPAGRM